MRQASDKKRINPRQQRARQTIDTILEATAQVLERNGSAEFTTNHIARRAGFSIGTLYRYFPHKKAILKEMAESALRMHDATARETLTQPDVADSKDIIALAVRTTLDPFRRSRVRKNMLLELIHDAEFVAKANAAQMHTISRFVARLHELDPARYREPTDLLCMTLSGALLGSIRMTLFFQPELLNDPEYERELFVMVSHFVSVRDEP